MTDLLLPYQRRWVADKSPLKIAVKSRRIGITWATAAECVITAAASDGSDCWYLSYNESDAIDFIRDAADWARAFQIAAVEMGEALLDDEDGGILVQRIKFASGHYVTAMSSHARNLRGKDGYAVIDEAAFHDDLDEVVKAALAFNTWGGRVAVISTHDGRDNAFAKLVDKARSGMEGATLHEITIYDALAEGLYRRICERRRAEYTAEVEAAWLRGLRDRYGDAFAEEFECVPSRSGGVYLARDMIEACMVDAPVIRYACDDAFLAMPEAQRDKVIDDWCALTLEPLLRKLSQHCDHYYGQDFGRVSDLSVMAPIVLHADMRRSVPFLVELRNVPFESQKRVMLYVCARLPRLRAGIIDATGNGAYLGEQAVIAYGSRMQALKLTEQWYRDNMPPMKAALETRTFAIPRDADVANDLGSLRVINGIAKLPTAKQRSVSEGGRVTRHGDAAIALALAYAASREAVVAPLDATPVGKVGYDWPERGGTSLGWV